MKRKIAFKVKGNTMTRLENFAWSALSAVLVLAVIALIIDTLMALFAKCQ